jgi:hypothetical protein
VAADLTQHSREALMDQNPWTYRVTAQEMQREGKLRGGAHPPTIADPRQYLFIELNGENHGGALAAWAKLKNDPHWYSSHMGRLDLAISRSGWFRTTIERPLGTSAGEVEALAVECVDLRDPRSSQSSGPPADCVLRAGGKAFFLDSNYNPGANLMGEHQDAVIHAGEMIVLPLAGAR